ncbi:GNAT family N-acetyltransferase [Halomonas campisalis]|uniref:GNAT family N-acetyltransferase n=1 Tax=Billgrantia campisalis TaxID=74661 RepID=A0ABS9P772_9GAMM|nr:GNAT family N-acetyltransferase [Halomonas campisalis]MCG6657631.1 GNAT family N-acetyltransferase [Halomonas campisalis]MDR5862597.1 GNAT family N-acetyltransferase [Halomonas campisalis]
MNSSDTARDAVPPSAQGPRILYRLAKASDAADQAEVFHHAVLQGAAAHYDRAEREAWAAALPREACAWAARHALYTTLVATCDGRCVGFAELDMSAARIVTLYVWPSLARRGIGTTLLVHAERLFLEHGHGLIRMEASLVLVGSLLKRGWRDLGEEWVERGGERLRRHRLEKRLVAVET